VRNTIGTPGCAARLRNRTTGIWIVLLGRARFSGTVSAKHSIRSPSAAGTGHPTGATTASACAAVDPSASANATIVPRRRAAEDLQAGENQSGDASIKAAPA